MDNDIVYGRVDYHSRFYVNLSDRVTNMSLGLFEVKMKVEMTNETFNGFIEVINNSMAEVLNRIRSEVYTDEEKHMALEEAFHQIRNFFGEEADVFLDLNMQFYGMMTAIEMTADWIEPIAEFLAPVPEPILYAHTEITFGETNEIQNLFIRSGVMV
jgi:hypothetical protein